MTEKYIIKILTLGDQSVGKSSIVLRYSDNKFSDTFLSTIGVDSKRKVIKVKGEKVKVSIWDTAGQEKFQNIVKQYYNGANGILLIFDITNKKSFDKINFWYNDLINRIKKDEIIIYLVGNKIDLEENRQITIEEAEKYANDKNIPYFEVSAKSGDGIKKLFDDITNDIMDKILNFNEKEDNNDDKLRFSFLERQSFNPKSNKCCL
jgi:small GTP-binding protein